MRWLTAIRRHLSAWLEMRRMRRQRDVARMTRAMLSDVTQAARMGGSDYPSAYRRG